jgi:hypothetical protein
MVFQEPLSKRLVAAFEDEIDSPNVKRLIIEGYIIFGRMIVQQDRDL